MKPITHSRSQTMSNVLFGEKSLENVRSPGDSETRSGEAFKGLNHTMLHRINQDYREKDEVRHIELKLAMGSPQRT